MNVAVEQVDLSYTPMTSLQRGEMFLGPDSYHYLFLGCTLCFCLETLSMEPVEKFDNVLVVKRIEMVTE